MAEIRLDKFLADAGAIDDSHKNEKEKKVNIDNMHKWEVSYRQEDVTS